MNAPKRHNEYTNSNWNFGSDKLSERLGLGGLAGQFHAGNISAELSTFRGQPPHTHDKNELPRKRVSLTLSESIWDVGTLQKHGTSFSKQETLQFHHQIQQQLQHVLPPSNAPLPSNMNWNSNFPPLPKMTLPSNPTSLNALLGLEMKTKFIIPGQFSAKVSPKSKRITFIEKTSIHAAKPKKAHKLSNRPKSFSGTVTMVTGDVSFLNMFKTCTICQLERHVNQLESTSKHQVCKRCFVNPSRCA